MMLRRAFLATTALPAMVALAGLTGCAGVTTSQLQSDVRTIATGVSGVVGALQAAVPSIPSTTITQLNAAVAHVMADSAEIAQALTPGQSIIVDFTNGVNTVASLAQPYYGSAPKVAALMIAAVTLVQTVLEESGGAVAVASISLKVPAMSPDAARKVLRGS